MSEKGSVSAKVGRRIQKASTLYLGNYCLKISDIARMLREDGDVVSEKTLREDLFVRSAVISERLHMLILGRDERKCEYLATLFVMKGNFTDVSLESCIPTSTVHEIVTKGIDKYPNLASLKLEVIKTIEFSKKVRTTAANATPRRPRT